MVLMVLENARRVATAKALERARTEAVVERPRVPKGNLVLLMASLSVFVTMTRRRSALLSLAASSMSVVSAFNVIQGISVQVKVIRLTPVNVRIRPGVVKAQLDYL